MRLRNWISTPQQLTMGLPQGSPLSPVLYNVYAKGLADLNSNGYACGQRAYLQNSQWHQHSSHCCPGAAGKGVTLVPRDRVRNQPKQGASPVVHLQQQSSRTSNASSLLQWRSHKTHEQSQIPRDPLRQNAYIRTRRRSNQQNSGTRKDCPR